MRAILDNKKEKTAGKGMLDGRLRIVRTGKANDCTAYTDRKTDGAWKKHSRYSL